ncbi:unnamed protein product [Cryptosporidium hominis]|uniref:tRNA(His) guanylyltransferase n=2 Tax=Cryptosporidium hominis TaxID=237895 RepID=A0A0S4TA47_CRYHO|nr:tRNA(His) guanylyltransferase [Cryptosporidium hominis]CUV04141.1 unnamed protein product [Cryptosporidium hominis]|eukprot:PPS97087.1 tRNA(His) guanylyltransferase [Cryptosporidium hominis]
MACSKYEYIKTYEQPSRIIKNCWFVVRIDGHSFHEFTKDHEFHKPNDKRGLDLMSRCAENVMKSLGDIVISYGQSDEFSFVFRRKTDLWSRKNDKILTHVVSLFTSSFIFFWGSFFPGKKLLYPPTFDGRIIMYPTDEDIRTYLSWRQADCHINNLYNTCFWSLVSINKLNEREATEKLKFTDSSYKNELLFKEFGINYNNISPQFRKGTTIYKARPKEKKSRDEYLLLKNKDILLLDKCKEATIETDHRDYTELDKPSNPIWKIDDEMVIINCIYKCHCDIIQDKFWHENDHLLK